MHVCAEFRGAEFRGAEFRGAEFRGQSADEVDEADEAAGRVREIYIAFSERYMQTCSAL